MIKRPLPDLLRQMLATLEKERQALAALDADALVLAGKEKERLCASLQQADLTRNLEEARGLARAAQLQNEVNRKLRNILAANVSARLDALTGMPGIYSAPQRRISS